MRYIAWLLLSLTFLPMFAQNAVPSVIRDREVLPKRLWDAYDKADADFESCTDPANAREPSWRKEDAIRQ